MITLRRLIFWFIRVFKPHWLLDDSADIAPASPGVKSFPVFYPNPDFDAWEQEMLENADET